MVQAKKLFSFYLNVVLAAHQQYYFVDVSNLINFLLLLPVHYYITSLGIKEAAR